MTTKTTKKISPLWWGFGLSLVFLILFIYLSQLVFTHQVDWFDQQVGDYIRSYATPWLTTFFRLITELGSGEVEVLLLLLVGGGLFFAAKKRMEALILAVNLGGSWLLNSSLKAFFQRERPPVEHLVDVYSYSYPSGHAMVSISFYGLLGYYLWHQVRKKRWASYTVLPLTILIVFLIGLSRIYLGVHYPSDVLAGFLAGMLWLTACVVTLHSFRRRKRKK